METGRARADDWPSIRDLLTDADLPLDGAAEAFATGIVVWDGDRLVGCAAIEPYAGAALLRSVAVAADRRGSGVGTALVHDLEELAADGGAAEVVLLTETAEAWFGGLGYEVVDRTDVPTDVGRSVEFQTACSDTAVAMRRRLP